MADEANVVPEEGSSGVSGASDHVRGALSFLSASFIQERMQNVEQMASKMLDRIIDFGLLADGYGPFENPVTPDMIQRMTPEQLTTYLSTLPSEAEKAQALSAILPMKLPTRISLAREPEASSPAPAPKLAFGPADRLNSQGES